jgi:hypothetical protein
MVCGHNPSSWILRQENDKLKGSLGYKNEKTEKKQPFASHSRLRKLSVDATTDGWNFYFVISFHAPGFELRVSYLLVRCPTT